MFGVKIRIFKLFFCFFNYESLVIVVSIIELTVCTLDGLILDLCQVCLQKWICLHVFLNFVIL